MGVFPRDPRVKWGNASVLDQVVDTHGQGKEDFHRGEGHQPKVPTGVGVVVRKGGTESGTVLHECDDR